MMCNVCADLQAQLERRKDGEIALLSEWADERAGLLATIAEDTESLERLKAELLTPEQAQFCLDQLDYKELNRDIWKVVTQKLRRLSQSDTGGPMPDPFPRQIPGFPDLRKAHNELSDPLLPVPAPEDTEQALKWLALLARPCPGALPNSAADRQSKDATLILSEVSRLRSQVERLKAEQLTAEENRAMAEGWTGSNFKDYAEFERAFEGAYSKFRRRLKEETL